MTINRSVCAYYLLDYGYKPIAYCQEFDFMHNKLIDRSKK